MAPHTVHQGGRIGCTPGFFNDLAATITYTLPVVPPPVLHCLPALPLLFFCAFLIHSPHPHAPHVSHNLNSFLRRSSSKHLCGYNIWFITFLKRNISTSFPYSIINPSWFLLSSSSSSTGLRAPLHPHSSHSSHSSPLQASAG
jgi:hypothetical protein